jgi:hypothetical protein
MDCVFGTSKMGEKSTKWRKVGFVREKKNGEKMGVK